MQQNQDHDASVETCAPSDNVIPGAGHLIRRLGPAGPLALIAAVFPALGGFVLLGLVSTVAPYLRDHQPASVLLYILFFTVMAGLALLPTYAQSFVAGWAFGFALGLPAALTGVAGAATLGYLVARRASGDRVVQLIDEHPKWRAVYDALVGRSFAKTLGVVTLLRIPPNSPFSITNLAMAAAKVGPVPYLLGTVLGVAPRTAAVIWLGATVGTLDLKQPKGPWILVVSIVTTIIVVSILGYIGNQAIANVTGCQTKPVPKPPGADA